MEASRTESSGGLLHYFLQLGSVPAGYGPFQIPLRALWCSAGYLLHHELPREARSAEDDDVVGPAGWGTERRHSAAELLMVRTDTGGDRERLTWADTNLLYSLPNLTDWLALLPLTPTTRGPLKSIIDVQLFMRTLWNHQQNEGGRWMPSRGFVR